LYQKYKWRSVPMIFIDDKFIGGFTDAKKLLDEGKLFE
jgi:glutaredoxin